MLYGLDIGGTKIEFVAYDKQKKCLSQQVRTPTNDYDVFKETLSQLITSADKQFNEPGTIGIGLPGFVDPDTDLVYCANVPCLNNRSLAKDLGQYLRRPVKIENDANCFVLSEATGGSASNYRSAFGIILGTGCGGGFMIDGQLHQGSRCLAGEWGHTPLPFHVYQIAGQDFPIIPCSCGLKGCLDNYLSGRGLATIYNYYSHHHLTGKEVISAYYQKDSAAIKSIDVYCELLACSLSTVINTVDPDIIVVGGGLSNFSELYQRIPPLLEKYTIKSGHIPDFSPASFGSEGGARGAAMLNYVPNNNE
ncbi:N-acetyl-D-glucosamine kinase [invertebrate metagenome]|uniref:N-acetylglucosamine kinase n=1 Tax=invertebrate metagenome TaxID=1711999 RepID=A0A2H9T572_9ZZZZ